MSHNETLTNWFAAKVFYNRTQAVAAALDEAGVQYYCPEKVIPSLIFVKTDELTVAKIQQKFFGRLWFYRQMDRLKPAKISEKEMELFIFVTSSGEQGLVYLGDDRPEYHVGDHVRVIDGPFKGAEGHIKRIKKDRRLVVTVAGVVAVATSYIHPDFLEVID